MYNAICDTRSKLFVVLNKQLLLRYFIRDHYSHVAKQTKLAQIEVLRIKIFSVIQEDFFNVIDSFRS